MPGPGWAPCACRRGRTRRGPGPPPSPLRCPRLLFALVVGLAVAAGAAAPLRVGGGRQGLGLVLRTPRNLGHHSRWRQADARPTPAVATSMSTPAPCPGGQLRHGRRWRRGSAARRRWARRPALRNPRSLGHHCRWPRADIRPTPAVATSMSTLALCPGGRPRRGRRSSVARRRWARRPGLAHPPQFGPSPLRCPSLLLALAVGPAAGTAAQLRVGGRQGLVLRTPRNQGHHCRWRQAVARPMPAVATLMSVPAPGRGCRGPAPGRPWPRARWALPARLPLSGLSSPLAMQAVTRLTPAVAISKSTLGGGQGGRPPCGPPCR
jgi:hypothetical protein